MKPCGTYQLCQPKKTRESSKSINSLFLLRVQHSIYPFTYSVPCNGQGYEGAEAQRGHVLQLLLLDRQMEGVKPLSQGLESLLPLQTGQGGAQAMMDAGPEGHMAVGIPLDVKLVRRVEDLRVPVGRGDDPSYHVAFVQRLAPHLYILVRYASDALDGGIIAQALLRCPYRPPRRVFLQQLPLVRMADEGQGTVADEVDGRFMACNQQQDSVSQHVLPGVYAASLTLTQHRQEVVLGAAHPLFDQGP